MISKQCLKFYAENIHHNMDTADYYPEHTPSTISSKNSMYYKYGTHINIMKWSGSIVMFELVASKLGILSSWKKQKIPRESNCIKYAYKTMEIVNNKTTCDYVKAYDILHGCHISVCKLRGKIGIDFCLFNGEIPTTKSLFLNTRQWNYLQESSLILLKQLIG
jgi:hypothetical protein